MRICLSMIVRDEVAVIERCLRSVKPHVDAWAIVDTGSSDGTPERVRALMADKPGTLLERPWVDFATNRNEALDLARTHGDYALVIDADEVFEAQPGFSWGALGEPGYLLEFTYGVFRYPRLALARLDAGWRWKGVLHETLVAPAASAATVVAGAQIRVHSDGVRSRLPPAEKYARDAEVLQRALQAEPDNTRYAFYLAQSLRDANRFDEAIEAYERRAAMGGWHEEVYYARLQAAVLKERSGQPYASVLAAYFDAIECDPARAEAYCDLARHLRRNGRHRLARQFAQIAATRSPPQGALIVDSTVYEWRARDELAVAEHQLGNPRESARLWRTLLDEGRLPAAERERIERNLAAVFAAP